VLTVHEDFTAVFVNGFFGVAGRFEVFDDDGVVDALAVWVQLAGFKQVVNAGGFGGFLGFELGLLGKVLSVVVAQMVV
jgi:hypothetical protein